VAGVATCIAPRATVYVNNHFDKSDGEREHVIIGKLEQLIQEQSPDVVCLAAGTYTRNNWPALAFSDFRRRHSDITLVAADVYALAEGLVNAYATGVVHLPRAAETAAKQTFNGMVRWAGTSFAAPMVAGLMRPRYRALVFQLGRH
jgi:hypothetical protein